MIVLCVMSDGCVWLAGGIMQCLTSTSYLAIICCTFFAGFDSLALVMQNTRWCLQHSFGRSG